MDTFLLGIAILIFPDYAIYLIIPVMVYAVVFSEIEYKGLKDAIEYYVFHCIPIIIAATIGCFAPHLIGFLFIMLAILPSMFKKE